MNASELNGFEQIFVMLKSDKISFQLELFSVECSENGLIRKYDALVNILTGFVSFITLSENQMKLNSEWRPTSPILPVFFATLSYYIQR